MNKPLGLALLAGGIILLIVGFNQAQSFSSDVSRIFTNSPSDRSIWFLVAGGAAIICGIFLVLNRAR